LAKKLKKKMARWMRWATRAKRRTSEIAKWTTSGAAAAQSSRGIGMAQVRPTTSEWSKNARGAVVLR
jgi:hypothetical protein